MTKSKVEPNYPAEPISILIPTYNRAKFLPLLTHNLVSLMYPKHLLEVVIDDDGPEPLIPEGDRERWAKGIGIKMKYIYNCSKRRTIGEKRNRLVKYASNEICAFMDDDDIYCPAYLNHSFYTMKKEKAQLVGSNCMIFVYPHLEFRLTAIMCKHKAQIHEATMVFTKKYHREMDGFAHVSKAEGGGFIQGRTHDVSLTDINHVMICVCHDGNTIDKTPFENKSVGKNFGLDLLIVMLEKILEI